MFSGQIEVDESYFSTRRIRGKRARGASGKTIVFGLLKREGYVHTEIVPNAGKATLQGIIQGKVDLESIIHSGGCEVIMVWWIWVMPKLFRVLHGENEFAGKHSHINAIESFWGYAKLRLVKIKGIR